MLKVFSNEYDWYVATDLDDAIAQWEMHSGEKISDYNREDWAEVNLDQEWKMYYPDDLFDDFDGKNIPAGAIAEPNRDGRLTVKATFRDWAEHNGRGFLCSTEY